MATKKRAKKAAAKKRGVAPKVTKKKATAPKGKAAAKKKVAPKKTAAAKKKVAPKKTAKRGAAAKSPPKKAKKAKKAAINLRAKKAAAPPHPKAIQRRDRPGHIDPKYGDALLHQGQPPEDDPSSFIDRPRARDDLAEQLAEEAVEEMTSAEHEGEEVLDQEVPEERGGPFVESSGGAEFADGTDASNPKNATREPFPRT